jgi:hypothetical protein
VSREQDEILVDLKDITPGPGNLKRLHVKLHWWHAIVSHLIALILVVALVFSIILYVLLLCLYPEQEEAVSAAFEKWYAVIGPFAGLALGAYYGASKNRK